MDFYDQGLLDYLGPQTFPAYTSVSPVQIHSDFPNEEHFTLFWLIRYIVMAIFWDIAQMFEAPYFRHRLRIICSW